MGRAYVPTCDVASTKRCKRNREEVRRCNEGKKPGTGVSKKKPAGSSRVSIGTADGRLSYAATDVGRARYW